MSWDVSCLLYINIYVYACFLTFAHAPRYRHATSDGLSPRERIRHQCEQAFACVIMSLTQSAYCCWKARIIGYVRFRESFSGFVSMYAQTYSRRVTAYVAYMRIYVYVCIYVRTYMREQRLKSHRHGSS